MSTSHFLNLKARVSELELVMLDFPTSDSHLSRNQDKINAFILLCHSEMESYFEDLSKDIDAILSAPSSSSSWTVPLPSEYYIYSHCKLNPDQEYEMHKRSSNVKGAYSKRIDNNNGIKGKDIISLFLPLGISYSTITQTLVNSLDSFGSKRGSRAHKSKKYFVSILLDRDSELADVKSILTMIEPIDLVLKTKHSLS